MTVLTHGGMRLIRSLDEDLKFSNNELKLFIQQHGQSINILNYELFEGTPDFKLNKDCIFYLKDGTNIHCSYRFRNPKTSKGADVYFMQDITFRYERPSGYECHKKMNATWFLYGVLTLNKDRFSRAIIVKWTNALEDYAKKHPEIVSSPIPNVDNSSDFTTIKIKNIPEEFIVFNYDPQLSRRLIDFL